jgi:hypothetical protein
MAPVTEHGCTSLLRRSGHYLKNTSDAVVSKPFLASENEGKCFISFVNCNGGSSGGSTRYNDSSRGSEL